MWWSQFIDLFRFETHPSSLLNFGAANSAVLDLKFPRHSRIRVFYSDSFWFAFQGRELFFLQSRNCPPLENIAGSFSEARLVSRDIRFP